MIYLIDSGHGGMINGKYQTAPKKMYKHPGGKVAYEGVLNREIKRILLEKMRVNGFKYIDICPTELDLDLDVRVDVINRYCNGEGANKCLVISLHSNAGKGTGFEIWTSVGQTKSDRYAVMFGEVFEQKFPSIRFRKDTADGDLDKESSFYILKNTKCPAILPEFLFFDNYDDYLKISDPAVQEAYAEMIIEFIKRAELTVV